MVDLYGKCYLILKVIAELFAKLTTILYSQ